MRIDKKALTRWNKASISYNNYIKYIEAKRNRFELSLIDLLYISNFKGGNSTINEDESELKLKLIKYSTGLNEIEKAFGDRRLVELNDTELAALMEKVDAICQLTKKGIPTNIDGFSISYLTALLHCYFPSLLPILDRRVLINCGIVTEENINRHGEIIDIQRFYPSLILEVKSRCNSANKAIRDIDRELFILEIPKRKVKISPK